MTPQREFYPEGSELSQTRGQAVGTFRPGFEKAAGQAEPIGKAVRLILCYVGQPGRRPDLRCSRPRHAVPGAGTAITVSPVPGWWSSVGKLVGGTRSGSCVPARADGG